MVPRARDRYQHDRDRRLHQANAPTAQGSAAVAALRNRTPRGPGSAVDERIKIGSSPRDWDSELAKS